MMNDLMPWRKAFVEKGNSTRKQKPTKMQILKMDELMPIGQITENI